MKLPSDPRLPTPNDKTQSLTRRLYELFREIANTVNTSAMWDSSATAAPATGTWAQGDKVENSAPVEAGSAGSKYIVIGWVCTASGTPGTWLPMRVLTGN